MAIDESHYFQESLFSGETLWWFVISLNFLLIYLYFKYSYLYTKLNVDYASFDSNLQLRVNMVDSIQNHITPEVMYRHNSVPPLPYVAPESSDLITLYNTKSGKDHSLEKLSPKSSIAQKLTPRSSMAQKSTLNSSVVHKVTPQSSFCQKLTPKSSMGRSRATLLEAARKSVTFGISVTHTLSTRSIKPCTSYDTEDCTSHLTEEWKAYILAAQ